MAAVAAVLSSVWCVDDLNLHSSPAVALVHNDGTAQVSLALALSGVQEVRHGRRRGSSMGSGEELWWCARRGRVLDQHDALASASRRRGAAVAFQVHDLLAVDVHTRRSVVP